MLTRSQASIILDLLDVATQTNWPAISESMGQKATPEDIVDAWTALEQLGGRAGSVPDIDDF